MDFGAIILRFVGIEIIEDHVDYCVRVRVFDDDSVPNRGIRHAVAASHPPVLA
jgi:hypothetical protein